MYFVNRFCFGGEETKIRLRCIGVEVCYNQLYMNVSWNMNMNMVVGSLAGDDTVMIVMRDNNSAAAFCGEIRNLIS